jgi:hypothetical protein
MASNSSQREKGKTQNIHGHLVEMVLVICENPTMIKITKRIS